VEIYLNKLNKNLRKKGKGKVADYRQMLISLLFPNKKCLFCGKSSPGGNICIFCAQKLKEANLAYCRPENFTNLQDIFFLAPYESTFRRNLIKYKYGGKKEFAEPLGHLLANLLTKKNLATEVILVPVPIHPNRLAARGYNQAELLATAIGKELNLPVLPHALLRAVDNPSQVKMTRKERYENTKYAFAAGPDAAKIFGKRAIIVDDICTTGATMTACASILKSVAAKEIWGITAASRQGKENNEF